MLQLKKKSMKPQTQVSPINTP